MKTLMILRHAKATQDASFVDFERPLVLRGRRQARALGRMMSERDLAIDAILASPATRVVETVTGLLEEAGNPVEPNYDRRLYNASCNAILQTIREVPDAARRLLVVGHNPGLQELVLGLAEADDAGLRGEVEDRFRTAALAQISLPLIHWSDVGPRNGSIVSLIRPSGREPAAERD